MPELSEKFPDLRLVPLHLLSHPYPLSTLLSYRSTGDSAGSQFLKVQLSSIHVNLELNVSEFQQLKLKVTLKMKKLSFKKL